MSITGLKLVKELREVESCFDIASGWTRKKKSITTSRTFGKEIDNINHFMSNY